MNLKHPLLRNPEKWLSKPKYLSSELYSSNYYCCESMKNDPIANMLSAGTGRDMRSSETFPKHQMIRMTLDNVGNSDYVLTPVVNNPKPGLFYSIGYVLNNYWYIKYSIFTNQWRKFVPLNFKSKNDLSKYMKKIVIDPELDDKIALIYLKNIEQELKNMKLENDSNLMKIYVELKDNENKVHDSVNCFNLHDLPAKFGDELNQIIKAQFPKKSYLEIPFTPQNKSLLRFLTILFNYFKK